MLSEDIKNQLITKCLEMKDVAYCPYSNYNVGSAVLATSGKIYGGCNIENASYGATICAERSAVFKAVSEGEKKFTAIAITGCKRGSKEMGNEKDFAFPCGACRQVIREFCNPKEMKVFIVVSHERYKEYTLEQLLPESFGPEMLI